MTSPENKNKDVLLIFPPLGNHEHPHLGLPIIKSYLANQGFNNCQIVDYNVKIMERQFLNIMETRSDLFGGTPNIVNNYYEAKRIMLGKNDSDKLKSGMAMRMISRYLRIGGIEICKDAFDPVSFHAIEKEFLELDVEQSDNPIIRYIEDEVLKDIIRRSPAIIGFSVIFPSQILYTLLLCRQIRKHIPSAIIFLGGAQPSLFYRAFLHSKAFRKQFDMIVREQGELPIFRLLQYFLNGNGNLKNIPNLAFIDEHDQIVLTEIVPSICMNDVGIPDYSNYNLEQYAYAKLPYMFSRGCYWGKCMFCGYRGEKSSYIKASVDKIVAELNILKDTYGIRIFHLMDDAIPASFLVQIAQKIIDSNLDICYAAFLRTDKDYTLETCQLLYKSGLRTVLFGFESADNDVLQMMCKGMNLSTMISVLNNFSNAGVMNTLSCIIGFPGETKKQAMKTIQFLKEYRHLYFEAFITPFRLISDMADSPEKYGIYNVDIYNPIRHDINGYVSLEYAYQTKNGMTPFEYLELVKEARDVTGTSPIGAIYYR